MVQNLSAQNATQYGSLSKIGLTQDGRAVYQITGADGYKAGKISIPQQDCDIFEKSYNDIIETAPKIEKFAQENSSPERIEKNQKRAKWTLAISTFIGGIIPAVSTGKLKPVYQYLLTAGGLIAGFVCGGLVNYGLNTPSGVRKFSKATETISKLDIQPVIEDNQLAKLNNMPLKKTSD